MQQNPNKYEAKNRVREAHNYSHALQECLAQIEAGADIDLNMITQAHRTLLDRAPGCDKMPGTVRTAQN